MTRTPLVVSVHALDTGLGEGFVADSAVFAELDCRAGCVATAVLPPEPLALNVVARQLEAVEVLGPVAAVRVGFLGGAAQVELVASFVRRAAPATTVVASPLSAGPATPLDAETDEAIRRHLFPAARVVVTRAADADLDGLREAARRLRDQGARAVVIAGALVRGRVLDLIDDDGNVIVLDTARIQAPRVPGLAGAHAAALAAHLARGLPLSNAAESAQRYIGFRLLRGR